MSAQLEPAPMWKELCCLVSCILWPGPGRCVFGLLVLGLANSSSPLRHFLKHGDGGPPPLLLPVDPSVAATGAGPASCSRERGATAALQRKEAGTGDPPADCAVCIAEVGPGEAARVLPRCGHAFHVECVDMWLRSHSTCPLCRCAVAEEGDDAKPVPPRAAPEADPESPNFPTNVLFVGSQDAVSTRGAAPTPAAAAPSPVSLPQAPQAVPGPIAGVAAVVEAARVAALRRLLGCSGATPTPPPAQQDQGRDLESGLSGGETSGSPPAKPQ